jgi:hypothetical protein
MELHARSDFGAEEGVSPMRTIPAFVALAGSTTMKKTIFAMAFTASVVCASGLLAKEGMVRFFSTTPIENIEGISSTAVSSLNLDSGKIAIKARNTTFVFHNKLMQEHFNENYIESTKFPTSSFTGNVSGLNREALNSGKKVPVTIDGNLDIHGVTKPYRTTGYLQKAADGSITGDTKFFVKLGNHGIKVPSVVQNKMSDSMEITSKFTWRPE